MIMVPIQEALTFDDVTLVPKYSEILPSEVDTSIKLTETLKLKIPLLSSAMDTVTESRMAISIGKAGGIGIIHRNLDIKKQVLEIKKVKKQKLFVGAAVGAGPNEFKRAEAILKENVNMIVVDTAHGHTKKVSEIIKFIKKKKNKKNIPSGVAHIKASFNNTIINISDSNGETIVWTSGGSVGFKGSRKSTPYAAQVAAEEAVRRATEFGVHKLDIIISGTGAGRETAVRTLQNMGMDVGTIKDITPTPHNGCRPKKRRRG